MIWIFKTSVDSETIVQELSPILNQLTKTWNFDLEDCDKILRVESDKITPPIIIKALEKKGLICEELLY
jgi:hypothetical protein